MTLINRDRAGYETRNAQGQITGYRDGTLRFDLNGDALDAHDGQILRYGDTYYLYGTTYGCGFQWQAAGSQFCGVKVYSSPDLVSWTPHEDLFDASTETWQERCGEGTYGCFRPHVAYNEANNQYVMWLNVYDNVSGYRVFVADSPIGPFTEIDEPELAFPKGNDGGLNYGDHQIFIDDDNSAYLVATDWLSGGDLVVERLNDDYTSGSGDWSRVGLRATEAPTIFERDGTYYLTYSDPNRGYMTTGTGFVTADNPLGPWTGTSASADSWEIRDGALQITGGSVGYSRDGEDWGDVIVKANVTTRKAANADYSQFGIAFGGGYQWLVGNYGHAQAPGGNLTKIRPDGGIQIVATPQLIAVGETLDIEIRAIGDTITTSLNGEVFDTTPRTTAFSGRVGFRHDQSAGESVTVNHIEVTDASGAVLLEDDFSQGLGNWDRPPAIIKGTNITTTSCGGQPTDVLPIETSTGTVYLYQSDVWSDQQKSGRAQGNQAVAKHYWQPLEFDESGAIKPITCGARYDVTIPVGPAAELPERGSVSSGDEGFLTYWDVSGGLQRAQTFTAEEAGSLSAVRFTAFQRDRPAPTGPLQLALHRVNADGTPGETIQQLTVPQSEVSYAARWVELQLEAPLAVSAGDQFAIVMSTPSSIAYGFAYSDTTPYTGGKALISNNGGQTWTVENGRVLHFEADITSVAPPADTVAPTINVKPGAQGKDGVFREVSFAFFDEGKTDKVILNGVETDLTDSVDAYLDGVKPGAFGGKAGSNELKVYDTAGNVATLGFVLDVTGPTVTIKGGATETVGTASAGYELLSLKLFDQYKVDVLTLNGVEKNLTDNTWSDLNGVKPGVFGAVLGTNELKVYDVAGNATAVSFTLVAPAPPVPAWVSTKVYKKGDKVSYGGAVYVAQWWTQNEKPGSSATGSWMEQGALVPAAGVSVLTWTASWVYTRGETVAHDGHTWKAKWWTRNQQPGDPHGPWQDLGTY
ncbi:family 43 glycosylhydrolase [Microbacterium insulae]|uniref:Family 43 glycosylhydrolase n=1 Tax=Microbacterium insulae TaxID=483014 RepID=A0ABW3AGY6_9MICO